MVSVFPAPSPKVRESGVVGGVRLISESFDSVCHSVVECYRP